MEIFEGMDDVARDADEAAALPGTDGRAGEVARGVGRRLSRLGYGTLTEFRVGKGRRVDVIGMDRKSHFIIVEIKTSVADFRGDMKWTDYLPWCDEYYFAVPPDFPKEILPEDHGVMVADAWDATILRPSPEAPMNGTRRRSQAVKFGLTASNRLHNLLDPRASVRWRSD